MARLLPVLTLAALALALPMQAHAGCGDRGADRLFAHPYGEPAAGCDELRSDPELPSPEREQFFEHPRGERRLQMLGITGMGSGAGLAGLGGAVFLSSRLTSRDGQVRPLLGDIGVGLAIAGGALFVTGALLVGVDLLTAPAPTPDGRGAQLVLAMSF
ncbi:MAG TPA: hypothetical protein DFS52_25365 [Myxococcales bacterium]|jgi:hypothetical protein|nr:hypothetical protein [Myxococcales bacterium]